jgi:hypothetical protein
MAVLLAACHSPNTSGDDPAARVQEPAIELDQCEDRALTDRLGRLHSLAMKTDEIPNHRLEQLRAKLAGIDPVGRREADEPYPGVPRFTSSAVASPASDAIYHDPRFEGEERPHILHWRTDSLGRSGDWSESLRRLRLDDGVSLALWRDTPGEEVDTLLAALRDVGVDEIHAVGQQDIASLADLSAPPRARALFHEMYGPEGARVAARTLATFELESIVFEAQGHVPDIDPRMLQPTMSLADRSRTYVDFLRTEYHRSGCELEPDQLVWLYRVRFLPDPPLAVRSVSIDAASDVANWEELLRQ